MRRLTKKDEYGNWCLNGVKWAQLRVGEAITRDVEQKLYGALCKLKDYEDTEMSPEEVENLNDFSQSQAYKLLQQLTAERSKNKWIPVEEKLPRDNDYVLLSFANFGALAIGTYEENAWYLGDDYGGDTCAAAGFTVNAWMPLPKPYRKETKDE